MTIYGMLNEINQVSLSIITVVDRHYNKDERMVPLMERIAWELAERVMRVINVRTLYRESPEQVSV